ncbi:ATP synthase subunit b [Bacteroidia bacterium]|nr:ATP synthase subunit b [Bacteroidia bacterium]
MELITPSIGLVFWMLVSFLLLVFLLRKFAWPFILTSLKEREAAINDALTAADKAREEMKTLQADNEKILREARKESEEIIKRAEALRKETLEQVQIEAKQNYDAMLNRAKEAIENERKAAVEDLKNDIATLSIDIAEKILEDALKNPATYDRLIEKAIVQLENNTL